MDLDALLAGYPAILRAWIGTAVALPPDPQVDCAACTRAPWTTGPVREHDPACCNFHPRLPSFLAGQALERGGPGAERIRARIASGDGVGVLGVSVGDWWDGVRTACPYWVPGKLSCSIWPDRSGTCRTYFCLGSASGQAGWADLGVRLARAEQHLAHRCALDGRPPPAAAPASEWEAWYRWCARHVAALDLPAPDLDEGPPQIDLTGNRRDEPLPDVLVPSAPPFQLQGERVVFAVAVPWARADYPRAVFALLAALDGQRTWREACAATRVDGRLVDDLFRAGIVGPPG